MPRPRPLSDWSFSATAEAASTLGLSIATKRRVLVMRALDGVRVPVATPANNPPRGTRRILCNGVSWLVPS